jgi:hypothetical protein
MRQAWQEVGNLSPKVDVRAVQQFVRDLVDKDAFGWTDMKTLRDRAGVGRADKLVVRQIADAIRDAGFECLPRGLRQDQKQRVLVYSPSRPQSDPIVFAVGMTEQQFYVTIRLGLPQLWVRRAGSLVSNRGGCPPDALPLL